MDMITITRRYHFEAAHWLPLVDENHKCHRIHGHNYEVEITVRRPIQPSGFLIDFWDLDKIVLPIIERIDHRCLNDIHGLDNPTAELISNWFLYQLQNQWVNKVRVFETRDCWATAYTQTQNTGLQP
jgi:6-pyruvoyltetrahydropterin/6-carboxytetrahydropterin synthase